VTAHVVVLHRWRDNYALYDDYLDHDSCRVTYVTTAMSRGSVPAGAASVVTPDDLTDLGAVRAALADPVARHGTPAAVVALQEGDLAVAASLREEYGCPGRRWSDLHRFIDKEAMLAAAVATGVEVPAFRRVTDAAQIEDFAAEHGWPVVVKPLEGRASAGVCQFNGPAEVAGLDDAAPVLVQRHVPHRVYHADGYFDGNTIAPWRLARYVNVPGSGKHGPLAFNDGEPVGEVEVNDPDTRAAVREFLDILVPGMSPEPWVFHCELFVDTSGATPTCTFLEVGCRPGGGEIPFVWRDVYGIDLMALEFALQRGLTPVAPAEPANGRIGGSLLVPLMAPRPAQVTEATSMVGRPDGPYDEWIPAVGTVLPAVTGTYEYVGGRFRFAGPSTEDVAHRIETTARDYVVLSTPVIPTTENAENAA